MRLRSFVNIFIFWLVFLYMSRIWSLKESSLFMFILSIFRFFVGLICWSLIVVVYVFIIFLLFCWGVMIRISYLFGLVWRRLVLYYCDIVFVLFLREEVIDSMRVLLKYIWWSLAYIYKLLVCTFRDKSFWNRF